MVLHEDAMANMWQQREDRLVLAANGFVMDSIVDGPGLRCTIFVQGCPHACPGCHNPATHAFSGGHEMLVEDAYRRMKQNPLCKGVTFSGGEPFCQPAALAALAMRLKQDGIEIAAYSGYTFEALQSGTAHQQRLLALCDVLIDGPFLLVERDLSLRFRGSKNQRILNVPKSLAANAPVWEKSARWVKQ